jgi:mannose-6-phosphate isomerase-like protein (cupin superfamily)
VVKINLKKKLSLINTHWDPKIIGELNQQQLRLVKFKGEFVWHKHDNEDELFLVLKGSFDMQFRGSVVTIRKGEFIIVPHGVEHCPRAKQEVHVLLFEPAATVNTGDAGGARTITDMQKI